MLYETYLNPYLEENETAIEDFIASSHDRLRAAGMAYLKRAIELLRTQVLGLPPSEEREETRAAAAPQGYTQALLARFNMPAARWGSNNAGSSGQDFFNMLTSAVGAATGNLMAGGASTSSAANISSSTATLIPGNIGGAEEKMTFITAQKEKLAFMMGALEKEALELQRAEEERKIAEQARKDLRPSSMSLDGQESPASRPPSGHSVWSGLSKSRSEVDFEKIDAESGAEDDGSLRQRASIIASSPGGGARNSSWSFLGWGGASSGQSEPDQPNTGLSSGVEK